MADPEKSANLTDQDPNNVPLVTLVGAGPGDPGLLTWRGLEMLRAAQVVVHDALANPALLKQVPADSEVIDAGKRPGRHKLTQDQINSLLLDRARDGLRVVRLKGGDPYLFGRGAEEVRYLAEHGVGCEVVPGITAGIAGPMDAGIPVTHRGVASSVTFVTGHEDPNKPDSALDYEALARLIDRGNTVCFYMAVSKLTDIATALQAHGTSSTTPAAVVQSATLPTQRSLRTTLGRLPAEVREAEIVAPAIIVVGQTAGLDIPGLNFFETRPLFGQTILVTRSRQQASDLSTHLSRLGARVIEAPTIELLPPEDWMQLDDAIGRAGEYDWLVLTSVNAVHALAERLDAQHLDARHLAGLRIACVGQATSRSLDDELRLKPDFMPCPSQASTGQALAEDLGRHHDLTDQAVLLPRSDLGKTALPETLRRGGARVTEVTAYQTRQPDSLPGEVLNLLRTHQVDWITFTSSSTARNLMNLLADERPLLDQIRLASIGPVTTRTLVELGCPPEIEPTAANIPTLVNAIVNAQGGQGSVTGDRSKKKTQA